MRAEDILPDQSNERLIDGVLVRKGSVGAFLANAVIVADPARSEAERQEALAHIAEALPALRALGLFDIFEIRDPGLRAFVGDH